MILQDDVWFEWNLSSTILLIFGIVIILILVIIIIVFEVKDKIHYSYHRGLRHGSKETIRYYETIERLIIDFDDIYNILEKDGLQFPLEASRKMNEYKQLLKKFQEV